MLMHHKIMDLIIPNKLEFILELIVVSHFNYQNFNESRPAFLKKGGPTVLE